MLFFRTVLGLRKQQEVSELLLTKNDKKVDGINNTENPSKQFSISED